MQIIIQIKPGASIARIEAFNNLLNQCRINAEDFADVIESIDAEGETETAEQKFFKELGKNFLILYSKKLKEQYAILAAHPPASYSTRWDEYHARMQGLERQLVEAGVEL